MLIAKKYISPLAQDLIKNNPMAEHAYIEVANSILKNVTPGYDIFIINNTKKTAMGLFLLKKGAIRF